MESKSSEHLAVPPSYSANPPVPAPSVQVISNYPGAVVVQVDVGPGPSQSTCRSCNQTVLTRTERKSTTRTHIVAGLLCLFGCWPCVCIPYCMDSCTNTDHYCSNCGAYIGTYMRI